MRIRTRVVLLLALFAATFMAGLFSLGFFENRSSSLQFASGLIFTLSLLAILFISIMHWVVIPLQLISKSLDSDNPIFVYDLKKDGSELGCIARLLYGYFEQREELAKEGAGRRKAEETLECRLKVEKALARVSGIMVSEQKVDFGEVLAVLGTAAGAKRASIFHFRDDGNVLDNTCEWCAPGVSPLVDKLQGLVAGVFERKATETLGARSLLTLPMYFAGRPLGFVAFENTDETRGWSEDDLRLLRAASEILGAYSMRKKTEEEIMKTSKLESLGTLASGIAHDFNNILTAILGNISSAIVSADPQDRVHEILTVTERTALMAKELTRQLLTFSKDGAPVKKTQSIAGLVRNSATFALRGSNVRCEFDIPDDIWLVDVDEGQIGQVVHNLVVNAEQAMSKGGSVELRLANTSVGPDGSLPLKEGRYARITVTDHGVGIPGENLPRIFDPYFTTKEHGSGLGLASAYLIVKKHDGHIAVESELDAGTSVHVYLPASENMVFEEARKDEAPFPGGGKVLVMDDDKMVRDTVAIMLQLLGYQGEFALAPEEAFKMYMDARDSGRAYDAVLMDLTMPGRMGARETIGELLDIDPGVKAIVSSGYSTDPIMSEYGRYGFSGAIAKPYEINELRRVLYGVINRNGKMS